MDEVAERRSRTSGELEAAVVECLLAADRPLTPAEVREALGGQLAYTTVMTTLTRLHAKDALSRARRGRAFAYEVIGDGSGVGASVAAYRMRRLLDSGADRAGVLSRFVDGLSPDDEAVLLDLLAAHPEDEGGNGGDARRSTS